MMKIRLAQERGHANFGGLDTRHTFSFGHYFDPEQQGFSSLRVINEDHVEPGQELIPPLNAQKLVKLKTRSLLDFQCYFDYLGPLFQTLSVYSFVFTQKILL